MALGDGAWVPGEDGRGREGKRWAMNEGSGSLRASMVGYRRRSGRATGIGGILRKTPSGFEREGSTSPPAPVSAA